MFYPKKSFFIFLKITVLTLVSVQLSFSQCTLQTLGGSFLPSETTINLTHGTYFGFTNAQTTPVISANITNMYNTAEQVAENYYSLDQGPTSSIWFLRVRGLNNSVSLDFGGCTYTFTVTEQKELNFDLNQYDKPYDGSKVINISTQGSGVSVGEIYGDNVHINLTNFLHWETSAADVGTYFTITAVFSDDTQNFELVGTDEHVANYYVDPSLTRSGDDFGVDDFSAETNWESPLPQLLQVDISKINLTINGPQIEVPIGQEIPIADWAITDNNFTGFVIGEDKTVLTTQPVLPNLDVNLYDSADLTVRTIPFEISGATSTNYNITHVDGEIDVYDPREAITLTLDDINVGTNQSVTLSPSAVGTNSSDSVSGVFSFNIISGESVFSLSSSTLTGITAGNGELEVSYVTNDTNNYQEYTPISVQVEVEDPTNLDNFLGPAQPVSPDSTFDFGSFISETFGAPANGFSSSDTDVVTVDENGIVTGVSIGTALVYVFHDNGYFVRSFEVSNKLDQDPIVVTNTTVSNGTQVVFTGGSGIGAVTYQTLANGQNFNCSCSADGVMSIIPDDGYTFQPEDKCAIIVTKQGDNDYNATSSALAYFPVSTSSTDTTAPSAPTVGTATQTTVTGTAEAGSTVTVSTSDGTVLGTATSDSSGNYNITLSSAQTAGTAISVTATDTANNVSAVTTATIGNDTDSDNDGISDLAEGYNSSAPSNSTDSDNDGVPDYLESNTADQDGDGTTDHLDADNDTDGDGESNAYETANGSDPTDASSTSGIDTDGDGLSDIVEGSNAIPATDSDNDGVPDYLESNILDADNDGVTDHLDDDNDTDGDGQSNIDETNGGSDPLDPDSTLSLSPVDSIFQLSVYPNPVKDILSIGVNSNEALQVSIFDINGKLVISRVIGLERKIDLSELESGIYIVNFKLGIKNSTIKVLKN